MNSPISSDDEEAVIDGSEPVSLRLIFQELKATQENILDVRSENHGINYQLKKLTEKLNKFKSIVSSVTYLLLIKPQKDKHYSLVYSSEK